MTGLGANLYRRDLAELHNLYYSDFVEHASPGAIAVLRGAGIRSGIVLDLGCGGGQLSLGLHRAGYQPIGIELSLAMVRLARRRVAKARFIRGSIAEMRLPRCSAAIAIGEVFNYMPSQTAIRRAFSNVFRSLEPGGILVFDIKEPMPGSSKKLRNSARWGDDWAIFVEVEEDPRVQKLMRKIVSFRKAGKHYRRRDEVHLHTILSAREIVGMLEAVGFSANVIRGYGNFRLSQDRKVLIARKPA